MAEKTPSIFPHHLPIDLSRGHPLGYHFIGSIWVKVFGTSNIAMHGFAIVLSSVALLLLFLLVSSVSKPEAGFFAVLLMMSQPLFVAQAFMVYPEMLLFIGLLISVYGYFKQQSLIFAIGLVISFLAKETGLVVFLAFVVFDLLKLVLGKESVQGLLKYIPPTFLIVGYLGVVYYNFGWFFYPGHTELMSLELSDIRFNLRNVFRVLIEEQNRSYWIYSFLGLGILAYDRLKWIYRIVLCAVFFSAYKVFVWKWVVPEALYWIIMLFTLMIPLFLWFRHRKPKDSIPRFHFADLALFIWILIPGFLLFSAMNFFTPRYLLVMLVPLILAGVLFVWSSSLFRPWMKVSLSILLLLPGFISMISTRNSGEVNLGLFDDLKVQQRMVHWFMSTQSQDASVCANFITQTYLKVKEAGYVETVPEELDFTDNCDDSCEGDYLMLTKTSSDCRATAKKGVMGFELIYTDTLVNSYASVYRRLN